jgi:hypothetical protein
MERTSTETKLCIMLSYKTILIQVQYMSSAKCAILHNTNS